MCIYPVLSWPVLVLHRVWSRPAYFPSNTSAAFAPVCLSWVMTLMIQPVFVWTFLSYLFVYLCLYLCVFNSWLSHGHQPGEEQTVPGRRGGLLAGGESDGPTGRLPGGQCQQSQYAGSQGSAGEGRAPPTPAKGSQNISKLLGYPIWSISSLKHNKTSSHAPPVLFKQNQTLNYLNLNLNVAIYLLLKL